ncbi:hypothetical protein NQ318_020449 [Aromia moschata]|uniref:Uncharacterized protein n=1 Tax=Aromia moschata TaxID=1265417 RepID=A0AAV8YLY5_9CUCU|nr:hypothetical protein NQ318_020449 [Aromia moschata]
MGIYKMGRSQLQIALDCRRQEIFGDTKVPLEAYSTYPVDLYHLLKDERRKGTGVGRYSSRALSTHRKPHPFTQEIAELILCNDMRHNQRSSLYRAMQQQAFYFISRKYVHDVQQWTVDRPV